MKIPTLAKKIAKALGVKTVAEYLRGNGTPRENAKYWSDVNVTAHARFADAEASIDYFHWRSSQYYPYLELMPVAGQDGKSVLDYGCGPGNDLVGFSVYSKPSRLIGMDISLRSIAEAKSRIALHNDRAEVLPIVESDERIPLEDASIDYVHSSGVVHHAIDPAKVLREFRRVLKPAGKCRIMVYNYDSVWLHLYVAYFKMLDENAFPGLDVRAALGKTTDGIDCPIARVYKPQEFIDLATPCGFHCRFVGAAVSLFETKLLEDRFRALYRPDFAREHREFLLALTFDGRGYPLYNGTFAGLDGCYELTPV
jgi:SAM-dependent methyltransferase